MAERVGPTVELQRYPLESDVAAALIGALNAELSQRYPEQGANHFRLDPDEIRPGRGAFFVAFIETDAVGCGAVRLIAPDTAEIKRMFVAASARRRGVGKAILARLEAEARALGARRAVLETAVRQPEALATYRDAGFVEVEAFGEYVGSTLSVCMSKLL